jgi:anti-sigma regulatory factor (Ser/Thr protein kinase)
MASRETTDTGKLTDLRTGEESSSALEPAKPTWPCLEIHSARPDWVEVSLPCMIEAADQLNEFLVWHFAELQEDVRESVRIALRELLLNAVEWGGKLDATKCVRVALLLGQRAVLCRIADPGNGFRIGNLSHAAIGNPDDRPCDHMAVREQNGLRPGGFGLKIVKGSIDELMYNATGNEVIFLKYTDTRSAPEPSLSYR